MHLRRLTSFKRINLYSPVLLGVIMIHLRKSSNFIQFLSVSLESLEVCTQYYSPILYEDITSKDLRMLFGNSFRGITSGFLGYKSLALEPSFQRVMPHVQTHSAKYPRDVSAATVTCSLKCTNQPPKLFEGSLGKFCCGQIR